MSAFFRKFLTTKSQQRTQQQRKQAVPELWRKSSLFLSKSARDNLSVASSLFFHMLKQFLLPFNYVNASRFRSLEGVFPPQYVKIHFFRPSNCLFQSRGIRHCKNQRKQSYLSLSHSYIYTLYIISSPPRPSS